MFSDEQSTKLALELDSARVKSRTKGNVTLSYLEGHDVLETANRIFGYGNWSYKITSLSAVSQEQNSNQNTIVCYKATVEVTVYDLQHSKQISREDVGFGSGIAKTLSDAHEGGAKEAVTDAIKRTLRSFGNQFGNSLYNKSQQLPNNKPSMQSHQNNRAVPSQIVSTPFDFDSLNRLGLNVVEQGQNYVVVGDDIYEKREAIKAFGFRFDGNSKLWWKPIQQQHAA